MIIVSLIFLSCRKYKEYNISGTVYSDCNHTPAKRSFIFFAEGSSFKPANDVIGYAETNQQGFFSFTYKSTSVNYIRCEDPNSGPTIFFEPNKDYRNFNIILEDTTSISLKLKANLSISDTFFWGSMNYIIGPVGNDSIINLGRIPTNNYKKGFASNGVASTSSYSIRYGVGSYQYNQNASFKNFEIVHCKDQNVEILIEL